MVFHGGMRFALRVTKYVCVFGLIILAIVMAGEGSDGPGGGHPHCDLLVNISAESINQANDKEVLLFNKNDLITLRFELINKLENEDYYWIRITDHMSDLYVFPLKSVKVTGSNSSSSYELFAISFFRNSSNANDYFEVNKEGKIDLYCEKLHPQEKVYFNFSTQISNKSNINQEYHIAELRKDNIKFESNRITRDNSYIKINKLNKIFIIETHNPVSIVISIYNMLKTNRSLVTPIVICMLILLMIFYIGRNLYRSRRIRK